MQKKRGKTSEWERSTSHHNWGSFVYLPCLAFCLTDLDTHPPSPSVLLTCLFWPIMHLYSLCNNCGPPPFCLLFSPASCFYSLPQLALRSSRLLYYPHIQQVVLHSYYSTIDLLPCCATFCVTVVCLIYVHLLHFIIAQSFGTEVVSFMYVLFSLVA